MLRGASWSWLSNWMFIVFMIIFTDRIHAGFFQARVLYFFLHTYTTPLQLQTCIKHYFFTWEHHNQESFMINTYFMIKQLHTQSSHQQQVFFRRHCTAVSHWLTSWCVPCNNDRHTNTHLLLHVCICRSISAKQLEREREIVKFGLSAVVCSIFLRLFPRVFE